MSARSRSDRQLNLPPTPLSNSETASSVLRKSEQSAPTADNTTAVASQLFDRACVAARLRNQDVAHVCGVSESLVQKWRAADHRECPSFAQLLKLPPSFHLALHRALNQHYGFGTAAVRRLLEAAGELALALEA